MNKGRILVISLISIIEYILCDVPIVNSNEEYLRDLSFSSNIGLNCFYIALGFLCLAVLIVIFIQVYRCLKAKKEMKKINQIERQIAAVPLANENADAIVVNIPITVINPRSQCQICNNPLIEEDNESRNAEEASIVLECKHTFHQQCLSNWKMNNELCPACNSVIILRNTEQKSQQKQSERDKDYQNNQMRIANPKMNKIELQITQ